MDAEIYTLRSDDTKRDSWEASASLLSSDLSTQVSGSKPVYQLHLVSKKHPRHKRPLMQSTKFERLSFYNTYTLPAWKTEPLSKDFASQNSLIWLHIGNFIFKSLSHTFVHVFLASYAPEDHIFLTKMVPFCIGHKFLIIIASLAALLINMNILYMTFYYFIDGLLFKNPWNRCKNATYHDVKYNLVINCYELEEFTRNFANLTFDPRKRLYKNSGDDYFSLAQYEYLRHVFETSYDSRDKSHVYYALLWAVAAFLTIHVSKKYFWKVLHCAHWSIIMINVFALTFILLRQSELTEKRVTLIPNLSRSNYKHLLTDLNIAEGVTTAPPLAHVLSSRSTQPIHPTSDSTAIIISNATYYMFRIYLLTKMSTYCKNVIGVPLFDFPNRYIFFLVWPVFFSYFYFGDLYSLLFLGLNAVAAILTEAVTFRCFIEMVIYEWRNKFKIRSWMVIAAVFISVILLVMFFSEHVLGLLCFYAIGFATLFEIIILYIFYPLGRLIDDYTFHYGEPPTQLRKISLQLVPLYYMLKFFALIYSLYDMRSHIHTSISDCLWTFWLMPVPLVLGIIFAVYRQHFVRKGSICQLFNPNPHWGPKELSVRELRKQYDSRVYVKSDVPRSLSRYLLSQAEPKVYKLNVHYEFHKKYMPKPLEVRFEFEKKKSK